MKSETIKILVTVDLIYDETNVEGRSDAIKRALSNVQSCNTYGSILVKSKSAKLIK